MKTVRASSGEKARSKKRGVEPTDPPRENQSVVVAVKPTPSNKELLKELPVGALPKTEPPVSDADWEEQRIKTIHDFQEKLKLQHPVEIRPRVPIFPPPRSRQVTELPVRPRTTGESGIGNPDEINLRATQGVAVLFSMMLSIVLGSPGNALLWIAVLGLYLSTFDEFRTYARNTLNQGLLCAVVYAEHVRAHWQTTPPYQVIEQEPWVSHMKRPPETRFTNQDGHPGVPKNGIKPPMQSE